MTEKNKTGRVLNRVGARELTPEETEKIIGTGNSFATPISNPLFHDA